jgi:hypothetical protein
LASGELWIKAFSKWYMLSPLLVSLPEWKHVCLRLVDEQRGRLDVYINDQLIVARGGFSTSLHLIGPRIFNVYVVSHWSPQFQCLKVVSNEK